MLVSGQLNRDSRVIYHRNISDRLDTIAPFLQYDSDPYLVIVDGRLFWIRDAYTLTGNYPYSTPVTGDISYIRNSVKAVIDAYHGTTTFYLADPDDPIARTLGKVFPDLLQPLDAMPAELQSHLRYPEDIFTLQTEVNSIFHMTNPSVFYNREDQWEVPIIDGEQMEPYYTIMRLPGEEKAEFIQMLPFTPRGRNNLAAWMVARSDGEQYGKMLTFQFPKQQLIFGPSQIVNRINQDQVISPQLTLWNQQGSEVIQGTLLVIPDRRGPALHPTNVSARLGRPDPRVKASGRRLPESDRHGRDPRPSPRASVRSGYSRRGSCATVHADDGRGSGGVPGLTRRRLSLPHRPRLRSKPRVTTHEPSRLGARATGLCTARRSSNSEQCSSSCRARIGRTESGTVKCEGHEPVGGELLLSPQSVEIIKFGDPGSGR